MNVLSLNIRGRKTRGKCEWVKEICFKNNVSFFALQETKMIRLEIFRIKSMWGNYQFDFACSLARGRSGGLLSVWDRNSFRKEQIWCHHSYIIVKGFWKKYTEPYFMVNIYGPQNSEDKSLLWCSLHDFIRNHVGRFILFGDLNEVRCEAERYGSIFNRNDADTFNTFLNNTSLIDLPLCGRSFTYMNTPGTKMSKLDRFLLSPNVLDDHPDVRVTVLDRHFGPTPFKFFKSWLLKPNADNVIIEALDSYAGLPIHLKLKNLKNNIKEWVAGCRSNDLSRLKEIDLLIKEIEDKLDNHSVTEEERLNRLSLVKERHVILKARDLDISQKARTKWDLEGDENSGFFHSILKRKRHTHSVQGIM
ncbi:uncharacterized protein [Rutidosis leptorrhynchoides]|uniref:uncharacterized protein n=1 Tax=Rutidosis leptorrhynchoides TaxID=125765 RepID=UPI003A990A81